MTASHWYSISLSVHLDWAVISVTEKNLRQTWLFVSGWSMRIDMQDLGSQNRAETMLRSFSWTQLQSWVLVLFSIIFQHMFALSTLHEITISFRAVSYIWVISQTLLSEDKCIFLMLISSLHHSCSFPPVKMQNLVQIGQAIKHHTNCLEGWVGYVPQHNVSCALSLI